MNKELEEFARNSLKDGLSKCTDGQKLMFKRMYAGGDLGMDINSVVDQMEAGKLDWAMIQIERTLNKRW